MIILDVASYCQDCRAFVPETTRDTLVGSGDVLETNTIVRCESHKKCAVLVGYLTRKLQNETDKGGVNLYGG